MMNRLNIESSDKLSFLRARDPSIISANKGQLQKTNLASHKSQEKATAVEEETTNINIYLRVKKAKNIEKLYKIDDNEIHCYIPHDAINSEYVKEDDTVSKRYKFTHIFPPNATQEEVFNHLVKSQIFNFINGENSTLMTYGASDSGKTFTLVGNSSEPGLVPRALEYLFRTLLNCSEEPQIKPTQSGEVKLLNNTYKRQEMKIRSTLLNMALSTIDHQHTMTYREMQQILSTEPAGILDDSRNVIFGVWVSFAEIYNECIYDLLTRQTKTSSKEKLQLGLFNENAYIENLTNISVSSAIETYQIFQYGLHNLNYAATPTYSHSSRSHSIFTIKIAQLLKDTTDYRLNYFNFCDFAGSEKIKNTLSAGHRLKELNSINSSLSRLFQRALTGDEVLNMVVNMNPVVDMFDENLHVLDFSAIAKHIIIKSSRLKLPNANRFIDYMQSRTTTYSDIKTMPEELSISRLQDIVDHLQCDVQRHCREFIELESNLREELVKQTEKHQTEIGEMKENHRTHIEMIQEMHSEAERRKKKIINLNRSSDENTPTLYNEALKVELNDLITENCNLKIELANHQDTEYNDFKKQIDDLKKQIEDLKTEMRNKDKTIFEQESVIRDAGKAYETAEATYSKEIVELKAKMYDWFNK